MGMPIQGGRKLSGYIISHYIDPALDPREIKEKFEAAGIRTKEQKEEFINQYSGDLFVRIFTFVKDSEEARKICEEAPKFGRGDVLLLCQGKIYSTLEEQVNKLFQERMKRETVFSFLKRLF